MQHAVFVVFFHFGLTFLGGAGGGGGGGAVAFCKDIMIITVIIFLFFSENCTSEARGNQGTAMAGKIKHAFFYKGFTSTFP